MDNKLGFTVVTDAGGGADGCDAGGVREIVEARSDFTTGAGFKGGLFSIVRTLGLATVSELWLLTGCRGIRFDCGIGVLHMAVFCLVDSIFILALRACNSPYGNVVNFDVAARIDKGDEGSMISCCNIRVPQLCTEERPPVEEGRLVIPFVLAAGVDRFESFDEDLEILFSLFKTR